MKKIFAIVLLSFLYVTCYSQTHWNTVSNAVSFKIKNFGTTVDGHFGSVKTNVVFDPQHLEGSSISGEVDVTTINTGINKRDKDLQNPKYFNSGQFKEMAIKSLKLYAKGNQFAGMFDITIKGVTKQMELPFQFISQGGEAELKSDFSINRRDFGVGEKSMIMGENVEVHVEIKVKS